MTLQEKFDNTIMRHDLMRNETKETIEQLEKTADEFAIGFAEFQVGLLTKQVEGFFYFDYNVEWTTTKELLEIYKKEKGL